MLALFRTVFFCAITLSFSAGALIAASFFIADRAPQSDWYIGVHLVVTEVFFRLGSCCLGYNAMSRKLLGMHCTPKIRPPGSFGTT